MPFYKECEKCGHKQDVEPYEAKGRMGPGDHTHCEICGGEAHYHARGPSVGETAKGLVGLGVAAAAAKVLGKK